MPFQIWHFVAVGALFALVSIAITRRHHWFGSRPVFGAAVIAGLVAAAAATLVAASAHAFAPQPSGVIAGRPYVTDGDTLRFGAVRVRLHGIQAPEMNTAEGQASRRHLVGIVGAAEVRCVDTGGRSYERVVARCFVGSADLAGLMVAQGWAFDWPRFSGGRYAASEAAARRSGRGLHSR